MQRHNDSSVPGYFLCYYIPAKQDETPVSPLLLKFKNNEPAEIVDQFCKWATKEFLKEKIRIDIIVRALCSNETNASLKTSLDNLGNELAIKLNAQYIPGILKKKKPNYPLKKIELEKRKEEIHYTYYCDLLSPTSSILIIDDIYTTGATTNEIIRAIKVNNPNTSIYIFTLGKTDFEPYKNEEIKLPSFIYGHNSEYSDGFEDMTLEYHLIS